ncbi:uncharacterized protein [Acropora muricata]|uniref:uncharacterized protein n=1 Tax=Acropora muricata TaxID=159855 RepID=UPI0034E48BCF
MAGIGKTYIIQKVHIISLILLISYCSARLQTELCIIQSYIRQARGSGTEGPGNLLAVKRVRYHFNGTVSPSGLTFTGSCNDPGHKREFSMVKKNVRGSLVVSFHWNENTDYVLAIRNNSLELKNKNTLQRHDYLFVYQCVTTGCKGPARTLKSVESALYVKTDTTGVPLVGTNAADIAAWFKILRTKVCYYSSKEKVQWQQKQI